MGIQCFDCVVCKGYLDENILLVIYRTRNKNALIVWQFDKITLVSYLYYLHYLLYLHSLTLFLNHNKKASAISLPGNCIKWLDEWSIYTLIFFRLAAWNYQSTGDHFVTSSSSTSSSLPQTVPLQYTLSKFPLSVYFFPRSPSCSDLYSSVYW